MVKNEFYKFWYETRLDIKTVCKALSLTENELWEKVKNGALPRPEYNHKNEPVWFFHKLWDAI